jgi:hypothetical protein
MLERGAVFIGNFKRYIGEACLVFGLSNAVETSGTCHQCSYGVYGLSVLSPFGLRLLIGK